MTLLIQVLLIWLAINIGFVVWRTIRAFQKGAL